MKAVIFDLDGTLVDTIDDIVDAGNVMFRRNGYAEHSREEFVRWIGNGAAKLIERGIGKKVDEDQLKAYVNEFKEVYKTNYAIKSLVFEGIPEVLSHLERKGVRISVLSNKPHALTVKVTESYLSNWHIYPVFGQRTDVPIKPDPSAALEITEKLGVKPEEAMLVGDSAGDINTALAAGMQPIGVSWGYGDVNNVSDQKYPIIHNPIDLINLL
ncbi:MAG TPA: HAD family hydrolase [Bacteroidales bacterium]|nr:HAD family hydrolase [Bacteroidales bacterium]